MHIVGERLGLLPFAMCLNNKYSSNKIRDTQNEHLNIVCQNLNSQ